MFLWRNFIRHGWHTQYHKMVLRQLIIENNEIRKEIQKGLGKLNSFNVFRKGDQNTKVNIF